MFLTRDESKEIRFAVENLIKFVEKEYGATSPSVRQKVYQGLARKMVGKAIERLLYEDGLPEPGLRGIVESELLSVFDQTLREKLGFGLSNEEEAN